MDVVVQPSLLQHEVAVSPIGLDETQHPVSPNINVKYVDLGGGQVMTLAPPKRLYHL